VSSPATGFGYLADSRTALAGRMACRNLPAANATFQTHPARAAKSAVFGGSLYGWHASSSFAGAPSCHPVFKSQIGRGPGDTASSRLVNVRAMFLLYGAKIGSLIVKSCTTRK
jgi:hypothetical protein